jgi:hypothetical protein
VAYSINWLTKVITIPLSDLILVGGSNYTLNVDFAHDEIRRLEWEFNEGLWAEHAIEYINSYTLSGLVYSPVIQMVNGYMWEVASTNINIGLVGSNSNFLDTFIPGNGISVLANNSAGKIYEGASGGLTPEQDATLSQIDTNVITIDGKVDIIDTNVDTLLTDLAVVDTNVDQLLTNVAAVQVSVDGIDANLTDVWKAHFHRRTWNKINLMRIYNVDGTTVWKSFDTNSDLSDIDPQ